MERSQDERIKQLVRLEGRADRRKMRKAKAKFKAMTKTSRHDIAALAHGQVKALAEVGAHLAIKDFGTPADRAVEAAWRDSVARDAPRDTPVLQQEALPRDTILSAWRS